MEVKSTHLHPFYGSENTKHTVLRLCSGEGRDKSSPTAYAVGLAAPQSVHMHKWYGNMAAISGLCLFVLRSFQSKLLLRGNRLTLYVRNLFFTM